MTLHAIHVIPTELEPHKVGLTLVSSHRKKKIESMKHRQRDSERERENKREREREKARGGQKGSRREGRSFT